MADRELRTEFLTLDRIRATRQRLQRITGRMQALEDAAEAAGCEGVFSFLGPTRKHLAKRLEQWWHEVEMSFDAHERGAPYTEDTLKAELDED